MNNDAQDILGGGGTSSQMAQRRQQTLPNLNLTNVDKKTQVIRREVMRCPPGMHRELFNLFIHQGKEGDNKEKIESLVPTSTKRGYTLAKAQFGKRPVRKWHWQQFENEARQDGLQLCHWEREDRAATASTDGRGQPYQFARFNKQLDPVTFTAEEYEECLVDPRWSKEETLNLLDLCQRFDLRWPIVDDRFRALGGTRRSVEDLKERYYGLVNELNALRGTHAPPMAYDGEHERRRKEQLEKLWGRTEEQIKEEEELKEAVKRIEAKRKERERKAHDLQRLINATERVSVSPDSSTGGTQSQLGGMGRGVQGHHRRSWKKLGAGQSGFASPAMPADPHIRWPEYKQPGPHMRSQEMKLPSNTAQRKLTAIGQVVISLQIVPIGMEYPCATDEIVPLYNDFRSNIVLLQDLKTAVHNAEQDLDQLVLRLNAERDMDIQIEPRLRVSELFYEALEQNPGAVLASSPAPVVEEAGSSGKTGKGGGKGKQQQQARLAPVTERAITKLVEVVQPPTATQTRKRRAQLAEALPPTRSSTTTTMMSQPRMMQ